jgi:voltage-gated potassium channel
VATAKKLTRHIQLLAALVAMELANPLMPDLKVPGRILTAVLFAVVCVAIFRAVFATNRRRWVAMTLAGIAIGLNLSRLGAPPGLQLPIDVALDFFAGAFFVFVLAVIVSHVFGTSRLHGDDVVGAFSGYMLIALIWGRLYALAWIIAPDSFSISPDIRWQLGNWHTLHALFDYYSFTTISSIGYGDITTTRPVTNTLLWLEVMCGQFYLAVVVATIVGMKMAQAMSPPARDDQ